MDIETEHPDQRSFRDDIAKAAPWVFRISAIPLAARITLIGIVVYVVLWLNGLAQYALGIFESFAFLGVGRYFVLLLLAGWIWRKRGRVNFGTIHGSAKWADEASLGKEGLLGTRDGVLLGRFKDRDYRYREAFKRLFTRPLAASDNVVRHFITSLSQKRVDIQQDEDGPLICAPEGKYVNILTVAPAGAGKGVGVVIPNLLNYRRSVIVNDIKGENYAITAKARKAMGQDIVVFDPFGISGAISATFNPLDLIDPNSSTVIEDLRSMADALIIRSGDVRDPHWNESAVNLIHAIMLWVVCTAGKELHTLICVKGILSNIDDITAALTDLKGMANGTPRGDILASIGTSLLGIPPKEFGSIFSTANRHTAFLNSELIMPHVGSTSFQPRSIATRPTTVYMILPAQYLVSHATLMRLWITSLLLIIKQSGVGERNEVMFMLDEVSQLGEMKVLEEAVTLLRGFGMRLWFVVQSINQLETSYPGPRFKTLLGNFGIQQYFGIADLETAKMVSSMIGRRTELNPSSTWGWNSGQSSGGQSGSSSSGRSGSVSQGAMQREHIQPEEILRANGEDNVFILRQGKFPILAKRITYYADAEFSPDVVEAAGSATSRTSYVLAALGILAALYWAEASIDFRSMARSRPSTNQTSNEGGLTPVWQSPHSIAPAPKPPPPANILIRCPICGNEGEIPASLAGETIHCRKCDASLAIPSASERSP